MAMTKKERTEFDAAIKEARVLVALRWTSKVEPDVPPSDHFFNDLTTRFTYNPYSGRIEIACSTSIGHARGRTDKTTTRGAISMYSTKLLALRAMRNAIEVESAHKLANIDAIIREEETAQGVK